MITLWVGLSYGPSAVTHVTLKFGAVRLTAPLKGARASGRSEQRSTFPDRNRSLDDGPGSKSNRDPPGPAKGHARPTSRSSRVRLLRQAAARRATPPSWATSTGQTLDVARYTPTTRLEGGHPQAKPHRTRYFRGGRSPTPP
ncbi:hypothetical protein GCM10027519_43150 [Kineococcus endophyticus]